MRNCHNGMCFSVFVNGVQIFLFYTLLLANVSLFVMVLFIGFVDILVG